MNKEQFLTKATILSVSLALTRRLIRRCCFALALGLGLPVPDSILQRKGSSDACRSAIRSGDARWTCRSASSGASMVVVLVIPFRGVEGQG